LFLPAKLAVSLALIFHELATNAGKVLLHGHLLARVWGPEYRDEVDYLWTYVRYLSNKHEPDPAHQRYILSEPGVGYLLNVADRPAVNTVRRHYFGDARPASTLKMLTATTLIPLLNPGAWVTASSQAAHVEPNIAGLVAGSSYQVSSLFNALLLISANDAAIALAQATGSLSSGITLMNAEAHHLQAYDIAAKDPNGLDAPGQHVSAYDLALVARAALSEPAFLRYDQTHSVTFKASPNKIETLLEQRTTKLYYHGHPIARREARELDLPISDEALDADLPPYYHPGEKSDEIQYMKERRSVLGGFLPKRVNRSKPLTLPGEEAYAELRAGSGKQQIATTWASPERCSCSRTSGSSPPVPPRSTPAASDACGSGRYA